MDSTRSRLVLHADDLGMSQAVSDGILRGFRQGLLTSTSLLANAPDAARSLQQWKGLEADRAAGRLPSADARRRLGDPNRPFDLGIHLNLTQGRPLSGSRYPAELLDREGRFPGVRALFSRLRGLGGKHHAAIRTELEQQVQVVCDQALQPAHLNGHQYIELIPPVSEVVVELLTRFGIRAVRVARERALFRSTVLRGQLGKWPLACVKRAFAGRFRARMGVLGVPHPDAFFGTAHAGGIDLRLLRLFLATAGEARLVEIGLHPSEVSSPRPEERASGWHDPLADSRPNELHMLLSVELLDYLEAAGWQLGRLNQEL